MRAAGSADNIKARFSTAAHSFEVEAGEAGDDSIVSFSVSPVDEDLQGRGSLMLPFGVQKYSDKEIWLTTSQADNAASPLYAVPQKQKDELRESLEFSHQQYSVGPIAVADTSLGASAQYKSTICLRSKKGICSSKNSFRSLPSTIDTVAPIIRSLPIVVSLDPNWPHSRSGRLFSKQLAPSLIPLMGHSILVDPQTS